MKQNARIAVLLAAAGFASFGAFAQPASGKGALKGGSDYEQRLEGTGMSGMAGMSGDHSSTAASGKKAAAKKKAAKKQAKADKKAAG